MLEAVPQEAKLDWLSTLKQVPLYREHASELMWFKRLAESEVIYLNLKAYPDAATFERVAREFWKEVDASHPKRMIIDVRQSAGGDFIKFQRHILKPLKEHSAFHEHGNLYVIIGRSTISAAMVNAIELRKEFKAILVGEPSGSKPNSYSENGRMSLPNSKLQVTFSTRYYKLQDKDTPSLEPDELIEPEWSSYSSGRDPVLEWILAQ